MIDTTSAEPVSPDSTVRARRTAGYFIKILARKFVYVESCLYDTAIERGEVWEKLEEMTELIEGESNIADRMRLRKDRIVVFLDHLCRLEKEIFENAPNLKHLGNLEIIRNDVLADTDNAVTRSQNIMNRRLAD